MAECKEIQVYKPPDLNARLKEEQDFLHGVFWPQKYPILYENDEPYFEHNVELKGELGDRKYRLRVYMSSEYPNKMPNMVVCESPEPMPDGPDWNGSHDTHTYRRIHEFLHICHWHPVAWGEQYWIFHVFNKGKEWLEAYEKYLSNGKTLPLELDQMELTEEEKVIEQMVEQRRFAQLHRWHMHAIMGEILSQRNLPIFPIGAEEISNTQRRLVGSVIQRVQGDPYGILLTELFRMQCAITECSLANPGCDINVSCTQTDDGQFHVSVTPTGPRSLQNS